MSVLTPQRLQQLASYKVPNWYLYATVAFSICNHPNEIPVVYQYAVDQNKQNQQEITDKMREALLKSSVLGGLPKAINASMLLKNVTPKEFQCETPKRDFSEDTLPRGRAYWEKIYGKVSNRVIYQMESAYPDLWHYTINHVYSPLLSYGGVLGPVETSLCVVACLVPQDVKPQLKGHLKGALNNGATLEETTAVQEMAIEISHWCGGKSIAKL